MARRGRNEGSVRKRPDGRWEARVVVTDGTGRRSRRSLLARTRPEAQQKLLAALDGERRGITATDQRQTVGQYLDAWLGNVKPRVRPRTYQSYECVVRVHLHPALGPTPLVRLSPQHVQGLLNARGAAGSSPRTVAIIRAVLRLALGQAERWGLVSRNVAKLADPPRVIRREVRPLDPAQARRFIELIADTRDEAMYLTALAVGLRQGELLGLSWRDIDLEASTLIVRNALQRVDGRMALVEPKSLTSRRTVVLPALVVGSLRRHRRRQMEERLVAGTRYGVDDWDLIFRTRIGSPMDGPTVNKRFQELLARNDLPRQRFHDLRHACASLLLAQGVAPRVVMETLGHSQISLTMNTYSHVIPALGRAAADRMDDILAVR
jgi:integrase